MKTIKKITKVDSPKKSIATNKIIKTKKVFDNINGTFDKGVNYTDAYTKFSDDIIKLINQAYLNQHELKRLAYLSISLIQLQNGSRISETIEATKQFISDYECKVAVIIIAKRKDGFRRKILLPELIIQEILERIKPEIKGDTI